MPRYERPDDDTLMLVERARSLWHGDLDKAEVTISVVMARGEWDDAGENYNAPIKRHGVRCAAKVKINPVAQRAEGMADATLTIDAEAWEDMTEKRKLALLDHELHHLAIVYCAESEDSKTPKSDDQGRPKLKMREHDFEVWGFWNVIRRHGLESIEGEHVDALKKVQIQAEFEFDKIDMPLVCS